MESMAYGALISATDPVCILAAFKEYTTNPNFFLLVFGESVLNDAVSMVFYDTIVEQANNSHHGEGVISIVIKLFVILIGSTVIGFIVGFLISLVLVKVTDKKTATKTNVWCIVSLPWVVYLISYAMGLSAIIVIFFLGISLAIYTKPHLKEESSQVNKF